MRRRVARARPEVPAIRPCSARRRRSSPRPSPPAAQTPAPRRVDRHRCHHVAPPPTRAGRSSAAMHPSTSTAPARTGRSSRTRAASSTWAAPPASSSSTARLAADRDARSQHRASLAIDDAGRVYVGSVGEFGYLEPDTTGELRFVSLADTSAGRRRPVRRRLAHVRHRRRRRVPERAADLPLGQRRVRSVSAGVAFQPGVARRRPGPSDDAGIRPQRARGRRVPRPSRHRVDWPRELPGRAALRPAAAAHRHALRRPVALRRRHDDAVSDRGRRVPQDGVALPRPGAARRHHRAGVHHRRASRSSIARAARSPCSIRRTACHTTPSTP